MKIIYVVIFITSLCYADFIQKSIKVDGETQYIFIKNNPTSNNTSANSIQTYKTRQGMSFNSQSDILIRFNDGFESYIDTNYLKNFEARYNISFQKKLILGYYQFKNSSSKDTLILINDIILNNPNIKTIKPNWNQNQIPQ